MYERILVVIAFIVSAVLFSSCESRTENSSPANESANGVAVERAKAATQGIQKIKPASGTGNVQGKAVYNGKPAENIEFKLCETFSSILGGCGGKTYTARSGKDGEFVITNVEPKTYEGLLARVFETDMYVFATKGIGISSEKYEVVPDKTLFVSPTHLFKGDLKVTNPKAGSKVSGANLELTWNAYPDADYYKMTLSPEDFKNESPYIGQRIDMPSFVVDKPLEKGVYQLKLEAFNESNIKLSENGKEYKFTISE